MFKQQRVSVLRTACLLVVLVLLTITAGCGPRPTPTPIPPTATPTPPPLSEADIAYFRGMLINPSASEMLDLKPPAELAELHLDLAAKEGDVEAAMDLLKAAAFSGDMTNFNRVQALFDAAVKADELAEKRALATWKQYLARYGLELPTVEYYGIAFTAPDDGWIVGSQGAILHYDGQDWRPFDSPTKGKLLVTMALPGSKWPVAPERASSLISRC